MALLVFFVFDICFNGFLCRSWQDAADVGNSSAGLNPKTFTQSHDLWISGGQDLFQGHCLCARVCLCHRRIWSSSAYLVKARRTSEKRNTCDFQRTLMRKGRDPKGINIWTQCQTLKHPQFTQRAGVHLDVTSAQEWNIWAELRVTGSLTMWWFSPRSRLSRTLTSLRLRWIGTKCETPTEGHRSWRGCYGGWHANLL